MLSTYNRIYNEYINMLNAYVHSADETILKE